MSNNTRSHRRIGADNYPRVFNRRVIRAGLITVFYVTWYFISTGTGGATGFQIPDQSARAIGRLDAFAAEADDPSAIYYNPAGLVQTDGTQGLIGASLSYPRAYHQSSAGAYENNKETGYTPFYAYFSSNLHTDRFRFGLGINTPFGMGSEWSETGFSRYWSTKAEMLLLNLNPTVAFQITPELSIGAGISYYYSELLNERQIDFGSILGMPGAMDGSFRSSGYGDAWGYNLGILYQPVKRHSIGLTFRSGANISYRGEARISSIPPPLSPISELSSRFSTEIDLPPTATLAYAFQATAGLLLEIDINWTGWKTFRQLKMDFDSDNPFFADQTVEKDWHNAMFYSLGAEYSITDPLVLRAGIGFMESPIPEKTFDTMVTRTKQYAASLGAGYRGGDLSIDLAFLGAFGENCRIENSVGNEVGADLDGTYRNDNYLASLSGKYRF